MLDTVDGLLLLQNNKCLNIYVIKAILTFYYGVLYFIKFRSPSISEYSQSVIFFLDAFSPVVLLL